MHRNFIRLTLIVLCAVMFTLSAMAQESSSVASSGSPQFSSPQSGTYLKIMSGPYNFPSYLEDKDSSIQKSSLHLYGSYSSIGISHIFFKGVSIEGRAFYAQASGSSTEIPSEKEQSPGSTIESVQGQSTRTTKGVMAVAGRELFRKGFFAPFVDGGVGRGIITNKLANANATVAIPELGTIQNPADDYTAEHVWIFAADAGVKWHIGKQFSLITAYHWNTGQAIQIGMETSLGAIGNGFKKMF